MLRTLAELSLGPGLLLFVVVPSLISACVPVLIRRARPVGQLKENNEFAAITYPVIGLFYGVFLAFAIVIVWQRFTDAESSASREVAALSDLWRDAAALPTADRDRVQSRIKGYLVAVTEHEWPAMADPRADMIRDVAYDELWQSLYVFEPHSEREKAFFNEAITQLNAVGQSRRERLMFSAAQMPVLLWAFLLFGGFVTIVFSYFLGTKHVLTHALTCAGLTSIVGFSLLLIMSLQFPFAGAVSIASTPYVDLLQAMNNK